MMQSGNRNQASANLTRPLVMAVDCHQLPKNHSKHDLSHREYKMEIIALPDPSLSEKNSERQYLSIKGQVFELVSLTINKKQLYGSYFVGSQVISDGRDLYVASQVDPLYFIIHYCSCRNEAYECSYEPLDQWWQSYEIPIAIQKSTSKNQLQHICDISNLPSWGEGQEDQKVYKFNATKTLQWLVQKYTRTVDIMKKKELQKRNAINKTSIAKSINFTLMDDDETEEEKPSSCAMILSLSQEQERAVRVSALQAICEYISKDWRNKLVDKIKCKNFDITFDDITATGEKKKSLSEAYESSKKRLHEDIHSQNNQEDLMQTYTMGSSNNNLSDTKKKIREAPKSAAVKRLAKVNTKGMKSMTSFFGAVKKQKR